MPTQSGLFPQEPDPEQFSPRLASVRALVQVAREWLAASPRSAGDRRCYAAGVADALEAVRLSRLAADVETQLDALFFPEA